MRKLGKWMIVVLLVSLVGCAKKEVQEQDITLHITVINQVEETTLFDDEVSVSGEIATLADFLEKAEVLEADLSEGSYGLQINGLLGLTCENWMSGPWWVYDSQNNKSCLDMGMCDAISNLTIADGDHFVFEYTSSFN